MNLVTKIYDSMIVHMTEKWYHSVLSQLDDNSVVLDVGIGTAGALLRCEEIIKAKDLSIIGIDYNEYYISGAKEAIEKSNMTKYVSVHCLDLYDVEKLQQVMKASTANDENNGKVDAVYFSGSFSLLPDPKGALQMTMPLLKSSSSLVYIAQTYQKKVFPLLSNLKPLVKYVTTIDFGQLIKVDEITKLLNDEELVSSGLVLKSHNVIEGSLDNYWQAAYLSILEVKNDSSK